MVDQWSVCSDVCMYVLFVYAFMHVFVNSQSKALKQMRNVGWVEENIGEWVVLRGDSSPTSAGPLPHSGNSLRNVHYFSQLLRGVQSGQLCLRYCIFFSPSDTLCRGNEFQLQRDKSDKRGGGLDGFHLALFMSQDKASWVREELRARRGGSSLVWLTYDKCM